MQQVEIEVMKHLTYLCKTIGPRPASSPQNRQAADYIVRTLQSYGFQVTRQPFSSPEWTHSSTLLQAGDRRFEAEANWRSQPCDLQGKLIPLFTVQELENADLAGCVALLAGELTLDELSNRGSYVYYPPPHKKINRLIDRKKPAVVITVCPLLQSLRHVIKDPAMPVPSLSVTPRVAMQLLPLAGESFTVRIDAGLQPSTADNLIATLAGETSDRIVLSAHYDTVWGVEGAFDNASGVSVLLALAQAVAAGDFRTSFEVYASNGEEFGGNGTIAYLNQYGLKEIPFRWDKPVGEVSQVWQPILANLNTDGVGLALGANTVTSIAASKPFSNLVEGIRKNSYPGMVHVDPWPASDFVVVRT